MDTHSPTADTPAAGSTVNRTPRRILLIDLDNCPSQMGSLFDDLIEYDRIVACHGQVEPRIPLTWVTRVAQAINSGRVEFLGMARGGKNAADFGLTFLAGRLSVEEPADSEYVVVSADGDLDHIVDLLRRLGRRAKRVPRTNAAARSSGEALRSPPTANAALTTHSPGAATSPSELPVAIPAVPRPPPSLPSPQEAASNGKKEKRGGISSSSVEDAMEDFIELYLRSIDHRPRKKQGLRNLVNMYFPKSSGIPGELVLEGLFEQGYVTMDEHSKLTYHLDRDISLEGETDIIPFDGHGDAVDDLEIPF